MDIQQAHNFLIDTDMSKKRTAVERKHIIASFSQSITTSNTI